jgi:hypothetical protein
MPREVSGRPFLKHKFTNDEDEWICTQVKLLGTSAWTEIAKSIPNRTPRQLRERWRHYLRPGVVSSPWSPEEDRVLMEQYHRLGPRWALMREALPGRSDAAIKNRFALITRRGCIRLEKKESEKVPPFTQKKTTPATPGPDPPTRIEDFAPWEGTWDDANRWYFWEQ